MLLLEIATVDEMWHRVDYDQNVSCFTNLPNIFLFRYDTTLRGNISSFGFDL